MDLTLAGLYVPLVTPFTADGQLAADALEALAHDVIDDGAAGLVALGTTGEPATLTAAERRTVLDICARVCRERSVTLIAGAGSNDTRASGLALAELTAWPEVSAALTVVPYYTRPSEEGVVAHFTTLAAQSPVPLIIYNIPYRTGQVVGWQALRTLADLPGIAGVKHAVGGIDEDTVRQMAERPERFAVLGGDDMFASALLALGADGAIMASAQLCTRAFADMVAAWRAGEASRARRLGHRLAGLSAALFAEPNPAVIKAALHAQGRIPSPAVRLPLLAATPGATRAALLAAESAPSAPGNHAPAWPHDLVPAETAAGAPPPAPTPRACLASRRAPPGLGGCITATPPRPQATPNRVDDPPIRLLPAERANHPVEPSPRWPPGPPRRVAG